MIFKLACSTNFLISQYVIIFLGSYPDGLHEVDVQILNNQVCSDLYGPMITETMMCTSGSNGRGSCYGDSGGPGIYRWSRLHYLSEFLKKLLKNSAAAFISCVFNFSNQNASRNSGRIRLPSETSDWKYCNLRFWLYLLFCVFSIVQNTTKLFRNSGWKSRRHHIMGL